MKHAGDWSYRWQVEEYLEIVSDEWFDALVSQMQNDGTSQDGELITAMARDESRPTLVVRQTREGS